MFKHLTIDTEHNKLLASQELVGIGELVEVYAPAEDTPPQASGRVLRKTADGIFIVHSAGDFHEGAGNSYRIGGEAILRILGRNRSGTTRRRFTNDEKFIVSIEKTLHFSEKKIVKAKTGSVRKKKSKA